MKKSVRLLLPLFLAVIFAVFLTSLVSAQTVPQLANTFFSSIYEILKPFLEIIVGSTAPTSTADGTTIFYVKLLAIILVFAITYAALQNSNFFTDSPWVVWTVCTVVSLFGVRFLSSDWIETILIPNSAFAVAVTAGLPFVLFFFVVKGIPSKTVRRVSWIFFAIIFLALWSSYADRLGELSYVYPLIAVLALVMTILDGTFQSLFNEMQMDRARAGRKGGALNLLQSQLTQVYNNYAANPGGYIGVSPKGQKSSGAKAYNEDVKYYEDQIRLLLRS